MGRTRFLGQKAQGAIRVGDFANLVDGELIVIGDMRYEWDDNASVSGTSVTVTIGASDAASIVNLMAAINANPPSVPVEAVVDPKDAKTARLYANGRGAAGNLVFTTTMTDGDNVISGAGLLQYGENGGNQIIHRGSYVVTAIDVSSANIMIETGLATPRFFQVDALSSTGLQKSLTTLWTITGSRLRGDFDGATDPVAGDVINWQSHE